MEFALDEAQQAVVTLAAEVLAKEAERTGGVGETGFDREAWKALNEAGLLSLGVPEELGGAGLGALEVGLVLREVGRAGTRVPALATLAFGVPAIVHLGDEAQRSALLADPERVFTAALNEPSDPLPEHPKTLLRDGKITGRKIGVPDAAQAHRILVSVSDGDDPAVVLVDPTAEGVTLRPAPGSSTAEWVIDFADAPAEHLGSGLRELHAHVLAGLCAVGDGAVAGALDLTAEHLRTRHQFGKPLAAFQAVAQQIADVHMVARTLHLASLSASWRLGSGRDAAEDLDIAAYWLAERAPAAMRTCHHLHGGLGLDITYPMHRYYAQVKDLARRAGGATHRLDAIAAHEG